MNKPLEVGDTAPDFTLTSATGEKLTLSEVLKNKNVVLAFFFLSFTST